MANVNSSLNGIEKIKYARKSFDITNGGLALDVSKNVFKGAPIKGVINIVPVGQAYLWNYYVTNATPTSYTVTMIATTPFTGTYDLAFDFFTI